MLIEPEVGKLTLRRGWTFALTLAFAIALVQLITF